MRNDRAFSGVALRSVGRRLVSLLSSRSGTSCVLANADPQSTVMLPGRPTWQAKALPGCHRLTITLCPWQERCWASFSIHLFEDACGGPPARLRVASHTYGMHTSMRMKVPAMAHWTTASFARSPASNRGPAAGEQAEPEGRIGGRAEDADADEPVQPAADVAAARARGAGPRGVGRVRLAGGRGPG